ncbi:Asator [Strongyloides ratti]|uniref:Asator n=1 Tax=Strongyloides ratti TaxID=34506 RepID=A0A090KWG6_STRRB|nr:Asator [Strongyloides ratti]CEF61850.1 Asator [Strongyloides ratti]
MSVSKNNKIFFKIGDIFNNKYHIIKSLCQGEFKNIYKCLNIESKVYVAVKINDNIDVDYIMLKNEIKVLQCLKNKNNIVQLICFEKKEEYTYMVMTLLGDSLVSLKYKCGTFTPSTLARIGAQILFGLKNLHEAGYVHRDIKPGNIAIGRNNVMQKIVHILNFGLCRKFQNNKPETNECLISRKVTSFYGTLRYCSLDAQDQKEQGPKDDLISLGYILADLIEFLPWHEITDKLEISLFKEQITSKELFPKYTSLVDYLEYVKNLSCQEIPNYEKMFHFFNKIIQENNAKFSDPYDWEILFGEESEPKKIEVDDVDPIYIYKKTQLDEIYCAENYQNI